MSHAESTETEEGDRAAAIARFEEALGYAFTDRAQLEAALRHSSYAHEQAAAAEADGHEGRASESNERLEFLGDAVLALTVAEALYAAQPDWREGDLTRALHAIVEGRSLAEWARALDLGALLHLGRTEEQSGGREKPSILEDAMEAVVGAVYLEGGLDAVRRLVTARFSDALAGALTPVARDPKTALQETLMAETGAFPTYKLVTDSGVEGDEDRFEMAVLSEGEELGRGIARTKRGAQKEAARVALVARGDAEESA